MFLLNVSPLPRCWENTPFAVWINSLKNINTQVWLSVSSLISYKQGEEIENAHVLDVFPGGNVATSDWVSLCFVGLFHLQNYYQFPHSPLGSHSALAGRQTTGLNPCLHICMIREGVAMDAPQIVAVTTARLATLRLNLQGVAEGGISHQVCARHEANKWRPCFPSPPQGRTRCPKL